METQRYLSKISGPLLDRIDLHIEVEPVPFDALAKKQLGESSEKIRERVTAANAKQFAMIKTAMEKLGLSARAYDRILKVARTIADLASSSTIHAEHIAEPKPFNTAVWIGKGGWGKLCIFITNEI